MVTAQQQEVVITTGHVEDKHSVDVSLVGAPTNSSLLFVRGFEGKRACRFLLRLFLKLTDRILRGYLEVWRQPERLCLILCLEVAGETQVEDIFLLLKMAVTTPVIYQWESWDIHIAGQKHLDAQWSVVVLSLHYASAYVNKIQTFHSVYPLDFTQFPPSFSFGSGPTELPPFLSWLSVCICCQNSSCLWTLLSNRNMETEF